MKTLSALFLGFTLLAGTALAETKEFTIVIKDHIFTPATVEIPAGEKVKLIIDNQDSTPEEFESHDLHREKIIPGNSKGTVFVGPLEAGEYKFFGEFNEDIAQGKIIAVEAE